MKLLLLAGTAEARDLAERLAADPRVEALAALAGATRAPSDYAVPVRHGGFGGEAGLEKHCKDNGIECVIDATHPFSRIMPGRAAALCAQLRLPYLRVLRPGWTPGPGDNWTFVADEAAAADVITEGARVFLATGRRSLPRFAALARGRHLIARVIDPPTDPFPFPIGEWRVGRPPFRVADEVQTLRDLAVDVLVAKDAGGPAEAKLEAARSLGLPVVMLRRPPPPPGDRVASVAAAMDWLERRL
ncbi:MAG: cobalt-precorrin-6A reductase [Paracoccaceae bacterium]